MIHIRSTGNPLKVEQTAAYAPNRPELATRQYLGATLRDKNYPPVRFPGMAGKLSIM
jgi:hypothetical protein